MIAVADSSVLVILSKMDCFEFLTKTFPRLYISEEVYGEVVVAGAGLPGAKHVANSEGIAVKKLQYPSALVAARQKYALGAGELSTILLGKELRADVVLLDDYNARKLAVNEGLRVRGSVGFLELFYVRGYLGDLREVFQKLVANNVYIDRRLLNRRLESFGLAPL